MPFKLIGTIILAVLVAILTGFNLSNKCTIWFFHNFENIPVFAALMGAFIAGVLVTIPFVLVSQKNKKKKHDAKLAEIAKPETDSDSDQAK